MNRYTLLSPHRAVLPLGRAVLPLEPTVLPCPPAVLPPCIRDEVWRKGAVVATVVAVVLPPISGTTAATTVVTTVEPDRKNVHPKSTRRWRVAAAVLPHICTSGTTAPLQRYYRLERICGTTAQATVLPRQQKKEMMLRKRKRMRVQK